MSTPLNIYNRPFDSSSDEVASQKFSELIIGAFDDSTNNIVNNACNLNANTEILNIIYNRIKNHIENSLLINDKINSIVFDILIKLLENSGSKLNNAVVRCLTGGNSEETFFYSLKNKLPNFIIETYGAQCNPSESQTLQKKQQGGVGTEDEIYKHEVNKKLKKIISQMPVKLHKKIEDTVSNIFNEKNQKPYIALQNFTTTVINKIEKTIQDSPLLKSEDIFSVIQFITFLEKIDKDKDQDRIKKINDTVGKILIEAQKLIQQSTTVNNSKQQSTTTTINNHNRQQPQQPRGRTSSSPAVLQSVKGGKTKRIKKRKKTQNKRCKINRIKIK